MQIGLGHLIRCLALAHMLKNDFEISFFCKEIPENIEEELNENQFRLIKIQHENQFFGLLTDKLIVVLDGYDFDTSYQRKIKAEGCKLVCIDDLHDKEFVADLIINHTPGINPQDYIAEPYTQFALGVEYALLRPSFLKQAQIQRSILKIETVLICFGGSDPKNLTQNTLQVASEFPWLKKIIVVTGSGYHPPNTFYHLVDIDPRIEHRHALNEQQMLNTMLESDLAIVPSSGVLLESLCCGCVPLICYYTDNQKLFFQELINVYKINHFGDNSSSFQKEHLIKVLKTVKPINSDSVILMVHLLTNASFNLAFLFNELNKSNDYDSFT